MDLPPPDSIDIEVLALAARQASRAVSRLTQDGRNAGLTQAAAAVRHSAGEILKANADDLEQSQASAAFRDRMTLTAERIEAMARGLEDIAALPDPLARDLGAWKRPNGLEIRRVPAPIGVIGMIYESRPNVGADAAGICLKSGNAVILRGGSESVASARAIHAAIRDGLVSAGIPEAAVQNAPTADRSFVDAMLGAAGLIDLIVPRGGKSLVRRVQQAARVPVLAHAEGLCHTYVHHAADAEMARRVLRNAKLRRPGICGATETLLIDAVCAPALLPGLIAELRPECAFRADARARAIVPDLPAAGPQDFDTEWLAPILSVAVVDGMEAAIAHIERHGSSHTEAIITGDAEAASYFLARVDSAVTMWNASTQFCDGGEFGFGAEIGIATGRIHARGPVGPDQLTGFRYQVTGTGQTRP